MLPVSTKALKVTTCLLLPWNLMDKIGNKKLDFWPALVLKQTLVLTEGVDFLLLQRAATCLSLLQYLKNLYNPPQPVFEAGQEGPGE